MYEDFNVDKLFWYLIEQYNGLSFHLLKCILVYREDIVELYIERMLVIYEFGR